MQTLIGIKKSQSQRFLENGMRIPVTLIDVKGDVVVSHKTADKDKYSALQLGFGAKKNATRAEIGHGKGAKLDKAPKFLKEVRINDDSEVLPEVGSTINPEEVFAPGDIIDVSGFSKGKGFQGGVKRHGFHGGPKTHGQSDRHRAPGAIGSGTTPGRVYKGKKMAGNMGNDNVTVTNLLVVDVTPEGVLVVKGLVPGIINGLIYVEKVGQHKKFVPLWKPADASSENSEDSENSESQKVSGPGDQSEQEGTVKAEGSDQIEKPTEAVQAVDSSEEHKKAEAASAGLEPASDEPREDKEDAK